ncbi:MerR family transcriptional regulator [Orbus mooreae]|uniref:MerR family transcriptional regulator n=1 Tax=Orbus mooreae TaxID=3074107 RepID=UPI00370D91A7
MKSYSIGEFAEKTQLTAYTLRYYEKENLLAPERSSNGRRYYTEVDLGWVHFIRRLKETAMPLKQIKQYALLRKQGETTFAERAQLLTEHREFVKMQLQIWQDHLLSLDTKIHDYQQAIKHYKLNK